jgi:NAD(P)-dependent dehydrogenase (short-subunit alcohol dehydrogenase family)
MSEGAMDGPFAGQVAAVVGGASGLGAAIVDGLRSRGARVEVADVSGDPAVDATDHVALGTWFDGVVRVHGRLDVLVYSAAVETRANVVDTTDDDWQRIIDVNLKGAFLSLKFALPRLVDSGGGSVVLLGSVLGAIGSPGYAAYCASKGALVNLAKQAASEHAADGVRVNVVSPSATDTGLFDRVAEATGDGDAVRARVAAGTPMRRLGSAADVVEAVLFLAGPGSTYISGTVLPVDGGMAASRV